MAEIQRSLLGQGLWYVGWPLRQLLLLIIRVYRKWISPALPASCKYHPSCSAYAVQSLERHGAGKGALLATWRLLKCNPFSQGGVNPIPERGHWRADVYPNGDPRVADKAQSLGDGGGSEPGEPNRHPGQGRSMPASKTESTKFLAPGV